MNAERSGETPYHTMLTLKQIKTNYPPQEEAFNSEGITFLRRVSRNYKGQIVYVVPGGLGDKQIPSNPPSNIV